MERAPRKSKRKKKKSKQGAVRPTPHYGKSSSQVQIQSPPSETRGCQTLKSSLLFFFLPRVTIANPSSGLKQSPEWNHLSSVNLRFVLVFVTSKRNPISSNEVPRIRDSENKGWCVFLKFKPRKREQRMMLPRSYCCWFVARHVSALCHTLATQLRLSCTTHVSCWWTPTHHVGRSPHNKMHVFGGRGSPREAHQHSEIRHSMLKPKIL